MACPVPRCKFVSTPRKVNRHVALDHHLLRSDVFAVQVGLSVKELLTLARSFGYRSPEPFVFLPESIGNRVASVLTEKHKNNLRYCCRCGDEHVGKRCEPQVKSKTWAKIEREKVRLSFPQGGLPSLGKRRP